MSKRMNIDELNSFYCPVLEKAISDYLGCSFRYHWGAADAVKRHATKMNEARSILPSHDPFTGEPDLTARLMVNGQDREAIKQGLHQIANNWCREHQNYFSGKNRLGLGIELDFSSSFGQTTIYVVARCFWTKEG